MSGRNAEAIGKPGDIHCAVEQMLTRQRCPLGHSRGPGLAQLEATSSVRGTTSSSTSDAKSHIVECGLWFGLPPAVVILASRTAANGIDEPFVKPFHTDDCKWYLAVNYLASSQGGYL